MKNAIPIIIAVVLGLAAVFAVSRTLARQGNSHVGKTVMVIVANGNLKNGGVVGPENLRGVNVPVAYAPKQHILWDQKSSVLGQTLVRDVAAGDYVQWNDIGHATSAGESVGEGEWAVPVKFSNGSLVRMLKPGDEIAIIGMFDVGMEKASTSSNADEEPEIEKKTITTVLFPLVRIMGKTDGGEILLSLPPKQAMTIIAAQEQATLFAALRRPHDEKSTNRKDNGMFDGSAFAKMLKGCPEIEIPDQPFNKIR